MKTARVAQKSVYVRDRFGLQDCFGSTILAQLRHASASKKLTLRALAARAQMTPARLAICLAESHPAGLRHPELERLAAALGCRWVLKTDKKSDSASLCGTEGASQVDSSACAPLATQEVEDASADPEIVRKREGRRVSYYDRWRSRRRRQARNSGAGKREDHADGTGEAT